MTLRSRMAIVVIFLLLGCVFAAPFYRSTVLGKPEVTSNESLPTLQIQRPPKPDSQVATEPELAAPIVDQSQGTSAHTLVESERLSENDRSEPRRSALFNKPIPDLQMPSPSRGIPSSEMSAIGANQRFPSTKPVTLIGVSSSDFGAPSRSVATTESRGDREFHGERTETNLANPRERFASNLRQVPPPTSTQRSDNELRPVATQWAEKDFPSNGFSNSNGRTGMVSQSGQRHRVARFDTLSGISKQYYGSNEFDLLIFEANRNALVNPAILPIGIDLRIPKKPDRTPRIRALRSQPMHAPDRPAKLPALPIENQYGWKRAHDDRERIQNE